MGIIFCTDAATTKVKTNNITFIFFILATSWKPNKRIQTTCYSHRTHRRYIIALNMQIYMKDQKQFYTTLQNLQSTFFRMSYDIKVNCTEGRTLGHSEKGFYFQCVILKKSRLYKKEMPSLFVHQQILSLKVPKFR